MRPLRLVLVLRLLLLVAIAASAALVIEYMNAGDPAFCGVGSGCFAVRVSAYSKFFGVPLPYYGLVAYAGLFVASLVARAREHHRFVAAAASLGALIAVALIILQRFVINALCAWCVSVDLAAILMAPVAVLLAIDAGKTPPPKELPAKEADIADPFWRATIVGPIETMVWAGAAALAIGLPFLWARYPVIPPTPPSIAALSVPGKLTIVGFTDFQCPFCRKLHPTIHGLERTYGDRIQYVRRMYPLPSHPGATPAAQAYLCVPETKREAAADYLYEAPEETLSTTGVLALADKLGLSRADLAVCMASAPTQDALAKDKELYEGTGARGLPLTYVGPRMVVGFNPDRIQLAVESELGGSKTSLKLSWMFTILAAVFLGAAAFTYRLKARPNPASA